MKNKYPDCELTWRIRIGLTQNYLDPAKSDHKHDIYMLCDDYDAVAQELKLYRRHGNSDAVREALRLLGAERVLNRTSA